MNQETAYKSTFATASTMGLSKAKLLKSAKKYLLVLDKENRLFSDSLNKQLTTRIQSKKSELKKIEDRLIANNKKIEELNKENQLLEKRLAEVNAQVEGNNDKLRETSAKFETALESLAKTIRQDVDLIEEYL